jgi:hypothetical protein
VCQPELIEVQPEPYGSGVTKDSRNRRGDGCQATVPMYCYNLVTLVDPTGGSGVGSPG